VSTPRRQRGVAVVVLLALTGIVLIGVLVVALGGTSATIERDQQTALALGKAREALIAYAAGDDNRPGALPCPDQNDDGGVTNPEDWNLSDCDSYVGRLPWKTLDLDDLRDGNGERLWYALTPAFRNSTAGGTLNSNTPGTLNVTGSVTASGVIALVFSAGPALATQGRTGSGALDPINYLDGENADGDSDYEMVLTDASNDRLLAITADVLFPPVERRIAREAELCLEAFAATSAAGGRYPWAVPIGTLGGKDDANATYTGRVPENLADTTTSLGSTATWQAAAFGGTCFTAGRWDDWRELMLYHVSADFAPNAATPVCGGGCLTVGTIVDVPSVVIVAGRALANPDQSGRAGNQGEVLNYLEAVGSTSNADGFTTTGQYVQAKPSPNAAPGFNDTVKCVGSGAC
jgi:hypothetical protein